MQNKKILVGVTGNIGSGKSLVCQYFNELGCEVFYADDIVKELYKSNKKLIQDLKDKVGDIIFDKDELSYDKLRSFIISSKTNQKLINDIVHPIAIQEILDRTKIAKSSIIIIEAALIYESGFNKYLNYVIVVTSFLSKRIKRVRKKKKLTITQILKITKLQFNQALKVQKGDFVIKNNSTKKELRRKVEFIYNTLSNFVI